MRWLIAIPIGEKSDDILMSEGKQYEEKVKEIDATASVTSSYTQRDVNGSSLFRLDLMIVKLSESDALYLAKGWLSDNECKALKFVAKLYGKLVYRE